jgi:hypothetical protein
MDDSQVPTDPVYEPTADRVSAACTEFDGQNGVMEQALTELFRLLPHNDSNPHVLLKVAALDALYSTWILALRDVARHIFERCEEVDSALALGSPEIVDTIAVVKIGATGEKRRFYSFASKYCSWHRQDSYPIWDSRVNAYLTWLRKRPTGSFLVKNPDSWTEYREFVNMINNLRNVYSLGGFGFKQIDKFLYTEGGKLIAEKERLRRAKKDTAASTRL